MADYQTLVVGVDFSAAADQVGHRVRALLEHYPARVHLVHVVEYAPPLDLGADPLISLDWGVTEEEMRAAAETQLKSLAQRLGLVDAKRHVILGSPRRDLVGLAEELGADLIVVGSHGRRGLSLLLGSTANAVLHHATCDVLAVRIRPDQSSGSSQS